MPRLEGVRIRLDGRTYLTGRKGFVAITTSPGLHRLGILPPSSTPAGTSLRFARWLDHIVLRQRPVTLRQGVNRQMVGFVVSHPVSFRVTDPFGQPLPLSGVSSITLTSSLGLRFTFSPSRPPAGLAANHIVRKPVGLVSLPVRYSLQAAIMDGANVVHEGGQSFYVRSPAPWTVRALVFPMRVRVRDALFGFAIGRAVKLTLLGGLTKTVDLGPGHTAMVTKLPRGQYQLVPKGPGIGLTSPVALSRPQTAKLLLFSWIDVAATLTLVVLFLVGLPLAGGRLVRRPRTRQLSWRPGRAEASPVSEAAAATTASAAPAAPPSAASAAAPSAPAPASASGPTPGADAAWGNSPWRSARRRRRRVVALAIAVAVVFAATTVGVSVVSAASNYAAGKQALAAGRYQEAADKLASAKILAIVPYANADSLYKRARALSARAAATVRQLQAKADWAAGLYAKANVALSEHRYGDAVRLYGRVLALSPTFADTQTRLVKAQRRQQLQQLLTQAHRAFTHHKWKLAALRAGQALAISSRYPGAKKLHDLAAQRVRLQPLFDQALAQANAGNWLRARGLTTHVLSEDPRFPGAAKLAQRIAVALAAQSAARAARPTPVYTPPAPVHTPPAPQPMPPPP